MSSFRNTIVTVAIACIMIAGNPNRDGLYLEDCDEVCNGHPDWRCQVRCQRIVDGRGEDCVNTFYDANNIRRFCYF